MKEIQLNKIIKVCPDNDSYNFWQEYDVEKIICEKTIYEEI
jgi:hypothetical protein